MRLYRCDRCNKDVGSPEGLRDVGIVTSNTIKKIFGEFCESCVDVICKFCKAPVGR